MDHRPTMNPLNPRDQGQDSGHSRGVEQPRSPSPKLIDVVRGSDKKPQGASQEGVKREASISSLSSQEAGGHLTRRHSQEGHSNVYEKPASSSQRKQSPLTAIRRPTGLDDSTPSKSTPTDAPSRRVETKSAGDKVASPERTRIDDDIMYYHDVEKLPFEWLNFQKRASQKLEPLEVQLQNLGTSEFRFSPDDLQELHYHKEAKLTPHDHKVLQRKFILANISLENLGMKAEDLFKEGFHFSTHDLQILGFSQGENPSSHDYSLLRQRIVQINHNRKEMNEDFQNMHPGESAPPERDWAPSDIQDRIEKLPFQRLNVQERATRGLKPLDSPTQNMQTSEFRFSSQDLQQLGLPGTKSLHPSQHSHLRDKFILANRGLPRVAPRGLRMKAEDLFKEGFQFSTHDLQLLGYPRANFSEQDHSLFRQRMAQINRLRKPLLKKGFQSMYPGESASPERAWTSHEIISHIENLPFQILNFREGAALGFTSLHAESQNYMHPQYVLSKDVEQFGFPEGTLTRYNITLLQNRLMLANANFYRAALGNLDMKAEDLFKEDFQFSTHDLQPLLNSPQGLTHPPQDHSLLRQSMAQINRDRKLLKEDFQNMYPGEPVPPLRDTLREASPEGDTEQEKLPTGMRPDERRKHPSPTLQWLERLTLEELNIRLQHFDDPGLPAEKFELPPKGQVTQHDLPKLGVPRGFQSFLYNQLHLQKKIDLANLDLSHIGDQDIRSLSDKLANTSSRFSLEGLQQLQVPQHYIEDLTPHDHSLLTRRVDLEISFRITKKHLGFISELKAGSPEKYFSDLADVALNQNLEAARQKALFTSILVDEKSQPISPDSTLMKTSPQQARIERLEFTDLNIFARDAHGEKSLDTLPYLDETGKKHTFSSDDLQLLEIPDAANLSPQGHRQILRKLLLANWCISGVDFVKLEMEDTDRFKPSYTFSAQDLRLLGIPDEANLSSEEHSLLREGIEQEGFDREFPRREYLLKHPKKDLPPHLSALNKRLKVNFSDTTPAPTHSDTRPSVPKRPSTPAAWRTPASPNLETATLSSQTRDVSHPTSTTRQDKASSASNRLSSGIKRDGKPLLLIVPPSDTPSQREAQALMSAPLSQDPHGDPLPNVSRVDLSQLDITQTDIYRNNINALSTRDLAHLGIPQNKILSPQERTQIMQRLDQENYLRHTLAKETGREYKRMKPGDDFAAFVENKYKGKTKDDPGYHQARLDFSHSIREESAASDVGTTSMAARMPYTLKSLNVLENQMQQFDYAHIDYSQVPLGELTVTQADIRAKNTSTLSAHDLSLLSNPQETHDLPLPGILLEPYDLPQELLDRPLPGHPPETGVSSEMRKVILQHLAAEHEARLEIRQRLTQAQGVLSPAQLSKYQLLQEGMKDDTDHVSLSSKDDSDHASLSSKTTQLSQSQNRAFPRKLESLTGWELNLWEAQTELDVAKHPHNPLKRYQADQKVSRIHEQKRSNRDRFFKKGLFPAFIHVLDTMQEIVIRDVKTPVEPTVSSKPGLQSDKGYEVIDRIREADKVNSQRYTRYAKANALSLFKRESEQAISKQSAFAHLEKAVLRESGKPEYSSRQAEWAPSQTNAPASSGSPERSGTAKSRDVKERLKEIRRKLHDAEQAHLQAHGTVDIESGEIKLNDHNPVRIRYSKADGTAAKAHEGTAAEEREGTITIALHNIKGISYDEMKKGWLITTYSSLVDSTRGTSTPLSLTKEARVTSTSLSPDTVAESSQHLRVPDLNPVTSIAMSRGRSHQSNISSRPPTRAASLARSTRETDTSFTPDDDLHSHYSFPSAGTSGSAQVPTCEVSEQGVFVPEKLLQPYSHTKHLINFKTGRIELANGTTLPLNEIDWTKTHADGQPATPLPDEPATKPKPPTTLHLKQETMFYKDGEHFDLSDAVKSLDADGIRHRTRYSKALKTYRQAQIELLEEAAHYGSQAYIPAVMAGIRTNENTFTTVINDLAALQRPGGIVSLAHYEDAVHTTMADASSGLLHSGQQALNSAFQHFTLVLKQQAEHDLAQQHGMSQFGSKTPTTLQVLEGTSGALSPTELQNNSQFLTYDRLMAIESRERTPQEHAALATVKKALRGSESPFTKNSYLLRKIAEYEAQARWKEVKQHVDALQPVGSKPGDSDLVKSRKQYENSRVDHIKEAFKECQKTTDANELRMALYEERYHDAVMQYNTNQVKKALSDSVTLEGTDHTIPRLKSMRQRNLDNIIADPNHLSSHEHAVAQKLHHAFNKATFRVKPEEFTAEGKTPEEAARLFVAHVRDLARYEIQALIDRTQETTAKEKIIDGRDGYEKDFTEKFIKQYDNEKTREHEFARLKEGRKAMKAFAIKQILISMIFNYQMGMNSFDQSVDTTLNSLIRNATRV